MILSEDNFTQAATFTVKKIVRGCYQALFVCLATVFIIYWIPAGPAAREKFWVTVFICIFAGLCMLKILVVRYRLKHDLFGTDPAEVKLIIGDIFEEARKLS